ncbi:TolC family protein [candidate division KSB1 bacterium]|nr:TolC family protein [candidate division KSB1 bacterium]
MKIQYRNNRLNKSKRVVLFFTVILVVAFFQLNAQDSDAVVYTLNACLETALKNNPQILASGFTVEESRIRIDEAQAGFFPNLSLSAGGSHSTSENSVTRGGTTGRENLNSGISLHYPIFQGFKTVSTVNAARANLQANQAQHRVNRLELVVSVTEAYYRLLQAERLVKVMEQSVQRARMHQDFSNALFKTGLASRSDILKAKVAHSDAQLALISARNARLAAQGRLNQQMGRAVQLSLKIEDDLETVDNHADSSFIVPADQFEKYLQIAFQNRPELDRIDNQIKAQHANIRFARSDYFPTLSVDGNYNYAGETISELSSSSYIGMSLSFPLFSGFSRPARVQQENLALHSLIQQQESLRQQIALEVWNAYLQVKEAIERIVNSRIFYENALENRNIAEGEYREGVGSMLDVIDAQTALVNSEQTLIEALADHKIALAAMVRAVGMNTVKER